MNKGPSAGQERGPVDPDEADFRAVLARARAGDAEAARILYARYNRFVRVAVRRRLHTRLRTQFDSLDFAQDVWKSFLTAPDPGQFESPAALVAFLTRVAHNKVVDLHRSRFEAAKYDVNREVQGGGLAASAAAKYPTPSQFAIADERWERLLRSVPVNYRAVLERLRAGYSYEEIARQIGYSVTTVNRIVRRLKDLPGV